MTLGNLEERARCMAVLAQNRWRQHGHAQSHHRAQTDTIPGPSRPAQPQAHVQTLAAVTSSAQITGESQQGVVQGSGCTAGVLQREDISERPRRFGLLGSKESPSHILGVHTRQRLPAAAALARGSTGLASSDPSAPPEQPSRGQGSLPQTDRAAPLPLPGHSKQGLTLRDLSHIPTWQGLSPPPGARSTSAGHSSVSTAATALGFKPQVAFQPLGPSKAPTEQSSLLSSDSQSLLQGRALLKNLLLHHSVLWRILALHKALQS